MRSKTWSSFFTGRSLIRQLTLALCAVAPAVALSQETARPMRIVVPYAAGGANDTFARVMAKGLTDRLKRPVIVENRPGGGLVIGTEIVARAAPNGDTILLGSVVHAINPGLVPKLPYDSVKDFTPVAVLATSPLLCVVPTSLGISDMKSFVRAVKERPSAFAYASSGNGAPGHLAVESIKAAAGIEMTHIPYKGASQPITDLIAGVVQFYCASPIALLPQIKEGKLRALVITSDKRFELTPGVPTLREAGVNAEPIGTWYAFLAPAGIDPKFVETLAAASKSTLQDPAIVEVVAKSGLTIIASTPKEAEKFIREETDKWTRFVKAKKITLE